MVSLRIATSRFAVQVFTCQQGWIIWIREDKGPLSPVDCA